MSNNFFSHPGKPLYEHLKNTAETARYVIENKELNLPEYLTRETLEDVAYIIGASHDFGKFSEYFQNYLMASDEEKKYLRNKPETHHGFISAVFALVAVEEYLKQKKLSENDNALSLPLAAFLAVRRHQGDLHNASEDVSIDNRDMEICRKQMEKTDLEAAQQIYDTLYEKIGFNFDLKIFVERINAPVFWSYELKSAIRDFAEKETPFYYLITLLLYSVLLDADKTDAAQLLKIKRKHLDAELVDKYRAKKFGRGSNATGINVIRNEIYEETISRLDEIDLDKRKIFSLNVPTGSGKTLTSFSFALKLRSRIEEEKKYSPRIIYSLPFLSIIEQNYEVINEVLENPPSDILLKHHYLSEIFYTSSDDEYDGNEADVSQNVLLIEGWNSEVIVTTFVQFFHSLITNKNRASRKFHNIVNSIVILDEIQAMPHKYWLLFDKLINYLAEHFNTYFIVMTATEPKLFSNAFPLVGEKEKYFSAMNRYELIITKTETRLENFIDSAIERIIREKEKDFLFVLNTIKSSITVYEKLKEVINDTDELFYLSTNIVPKLRAERIKKIKRGNGKRKIIVSTQMIEAGVDIDVDVVFRDFAPLDAVNQTAGRCNRNFQSEHGEVNLVNLFIENEETGKKYFPRKIYDTFLISKAEEAAENLERLPENEFLTLTEKYFELVASGKSDETSRRIFRDVTSLNFGELSRFTLIEKDYPSVDIFIAVDYEAEKTWEKYEEIGSSEELSLTEKRNEYLKLKNKLNDYIISVPQNLAEGFQKGTINYVSREELAIYYDEETGYKREHAGEGTLGF